MDQPTAWLVKTPKNEKKRSFIEINSPRPRLHWRHECLWLRYSENLFLGLLACVGYRSSGQKAITWWTDGTVDTRAQLSQWMNEFYLRGARSFVKIRHISETPKSFRLASSWDGRKVRWSCKHWFFVFRPSSWHRTCDCDAEWTTTPTRPHF